MSYTSYFYLLFFLGVLVALYYLMPLKNGGWCCWAAVISSTGWPPENDRFSADHNRFGLSGSSGYGAGAAGL